MNSEQSPTKVMNQSLRKQQTKKLKIGKSPSKKDGHHGESKDNKESGLASPTSVTM